MSIYFFFAPRNAVTKQCSGSVKFFFILTSKKNLFDGILRATAYIPDLENENKYDKCGMDLKLFLEESFIVSH